MKDPWKWKKEFDALVPEFIEKHFGSADRITQLFPYMKADFKWKDKTVIPSDVRTVAKNNVEYHGLERHAREYHFSGMYQDAYEFWLIAAAWRRQNMRANGFMDAPHLNALSFTIRMACFNRDLAAWQRGEGPMVQPEEYEIDETTIAAHDREAQRQINDEVTARGGAAPYAVD